MRDQETWEGSRLKAQTPQNSVTERPRSKLAPYMNSFK